MGIGTTLTLHIPADRQGLAAGVSQDPGPHSHSSASACLNDKVREVAKWLQDALDGDQPFAQLHMAHLTFYAGDEEAALAHLKEHLSRRVQQGRYTCAGCGQTLGVCSADYQKMASSPLWAGIR
jgi:hypothetical protein